MNLKLQLFVFFSFSSFFLGWVFISSHVAQATPSGVTITVNSTLDEPDAELDGVCSSIPSGVCTLRAAIQEANSSTDTDIIALPSGTYLLTRLGSNEDFGSTGDLDIFTNVSIIGEDNETTIIDANRLVTADRAIHVHDQNGIGNVEVNISGMTIRNGVGIMGGGILLEDVTLNLEQVVVRDNLAQNSVGTSRGGGIENDGGTLSLNFSSIRDNTTLCPSCNADGGGIDNVESSILIIENSYIMDNEAGFGGGIHNKGTLLVFNSLFWLNQAALRGGGIYTDLGIATLVNTTTSQNGAGIFGGGIYLETGTVNIYNNTIVNNDADNNDDGVGTHGGIAVVTGTLTMYNTILANNSGANNPNNDDCGNSVIHSGGYNLIRNTCIIIGDTTGNLYGINPHLDALAGNGGPTLTHALLVSSPAIDAGNLTGCVDQTQAFLLDIDQRGYARHVDGGSGTARCDIGAYEYGATPPPTPTPSPTPSATPTNTPVPGELLNIFLPVVTR